MNFRCSFLLLAAAMTHPHVATTGSGTCLRGVCNCSEARSYLCLEYKTRSFPKRDWILGRPSEKRREHAGRPHMTHGQLAALRVGLAQAAWRAWRAPQRPAAHWQRGISWHDATTSQ